MRVGTEYLIAYGLIHQLERGKDTISFGDLNKYGILLQNVLNSQNIDAVVLNHSYLESVYSNSQYFEYIEINSIPFVKVVRGVSEDSLKNRFSYLPLEILMILTDKNI